MRVLDRPRLASLLDTADLVTLEAPAGYGKTTLLASWAVSSSEAVAWLTLTEADRDPARFWRDLMTAIRNSRHDAVRVLGDLEPSWDETDGAALVAALHRALSEGGTPLTLIIDDVDVLADGPRSLEQLTVLTLEGPPLLRVILAGRRRLDLRGSRSGRTVVSIGPTDLAFTPDETARMLRGTPAALDQRTVEQVQSVTGGWPVAVQLYVLGARPGRPEARLRPTDTRELTQYLVSEVLDRLDPEQRSFVIDASIDGSVCSALLDRVRGAADSAARLGSCYEQALFLTIEGDRLPGGTWYRWHDLFVTHVRRVALEEDPRRHRMLHGRAAQWWRPVDTVVAVHHALLAGRSELGAELAADAWPELVLRGMTETVGELVRQLPDGLDHEAELHLATAFIEANGGDSDAAGASLHRARGAAGRLSEPDRARFDARAAALTLLFDAAGDAPLTQTVERGRELLRRIETGPWTPDSVTLMLTRLSVGMGAARLRLDHEYALSLLQSAAAIAGRQGFIAVQLVAAAESCLPLMASDRLALAARTALDVVTRTQDRGWEPPRALAPALYFRGWYAYWSADLVDAREALSTAAELLRGIDSVLVGLATCLHGLSCLRAGDTTAALADLEAARVLSRGGVVAPYWPSLVRAFEAEAYLALGDRSRAHRLAATQAHGRQDPLATVSRARVLTGLEDWEAGLSVLGHVAPEPSTPIRIEALTTRSLALWQSGDVRSAREALDEALGLAEPHGLVLPFLTDWARTEPVIHDLAPYSTHPGMLAKVRAAGSGQGARGRRDPVLTEREQAMLRHLRSDLTVAEIAAAEYVSVNTVKTHLARVYRKLQVDSRRDAVRVARELGIL